MKYCIDRNNNRIAYKKVTGTRASVIFYGGFASNMNGTKANALYEFCQKSDIELTLFDYLGHGSSNGQFTDYTVSNWHENCLEVIEKLTNGKQIIIGSSMGGWLMLLTALSMPERVSALIGISAAPDFTEELIFNKLSDQQKDDLLSLGVIDFISDDSSCSYKITKNLIKDGRKNLLLNKNNIDINCPVRLLHGLNDKDVPYNYSLTLAEKIKSSNAEVHLIKSAEHSMSDNNSLNLLFKTLSEFIY